MTDYTTELLQLSCYVIGILTGALLLAIGLIIYYRRKLSRVRMADDDFVPSESDTALWEAPTPVRATDTPGVSSPQDEDSEVVVPSEAESEEEAPSPQMEVKHMTKAELAENRLYQDVTTAIVNERLYLKAGFGRSDIVERFGISAHRAGMIFSKRDTSIPEFVRNCRLDYACQQMKDDPQSGLADIAASSGFIHLSTFIRDFKDRYGMTPARYRETLPETTKPNNDIL